MVRKEVSQTIDKYKKGTYATKLRTRQNALIQSEVFEQTIILLGDTSEDLEKKGAKR